MSNPVIFTKTLQIVSLCLQIFLLNLFLALHICYRKIRIHERNQLGSSSKQTTMQQNTYHFVNPMMPKRLQANIIVSRLLSLWLNLWDFYRHEWYIVVLQRSPNPWKSKKKKKIFYFPFRLLTSTRYQIYNNVLLSAYVWTGNI